MSMVIHQAERTTSARPITRSSEAVVQAEGLTKRYRSFTAVSGVSFEVRRGEVFGFLGPNGSGKSTTIGMMLGLVSPTAGTVSLFGHGATERSAGLARVGAIIESPAFYPYMTGYDNLKALSHLRPGVTDARITDVLEIVGLRDAGKKKYSQYSLGMKQRLGIGWTLLHDPELLVLDEPTNGLDPAGMQEVRHLILRLATEGKTIFISSHLLNEVEQVCDRVAIIQRGSIIAEGAVSDLISRDQRLLIRTTALERAADLVSAIPGVQSVERRPNEIVVIAPDVRPATINTMLVSQGIEVDELRTMRNTLEEAFLELTGDGNGAEVTTGVSEGAEVGA